MDHPQQQNDAHLMTGLLDKTETEIVISPLNVQGTNDTDTQNSEIGTNISADTDFKNDSVEWIVKYDPKGESATIIKKPREHSIDDISLWKKGCRTTKLESDYKEADYSRY